MSLVPLAAALIRLAATDVGYQRNLTIATADALALQGLVDSTIGEQDLPWLSPSEWLWFLQWRRDRGGAIAEVVLRHLEEQFQYGPRYLQFSLRGVVLLDPAANVEAAYLVSERQEVEGSGLRWLRSHALEAAQPLDLARDALQFGTPAAWYVLRTLTAAREGRSSEVRAWLGRFAGARRLDRETTTQWRFEEYR